MRVRRASLHDWYVEDGRSVVMVGEEVIVLSELATVILESVPSVGTATLEHLVEAAVDELGHPAPPQDATDLVRDNVHDLVSHRVLVLADGGSSTSASDQETALAATHALHSAMAAVLAPDGRWALPADLPERDFLIAVRRQRVGGQIVTGLERLDLPASLRSHLHADSDRMRAACLDLGRDLHSVLDNLAAAGVRALTFKGLALAAQAWGDEAARGYGDLDLLVPPSDLDLAHRVLLADGWLHAAEFPVPGSSWGWRQFARSNYEMPLSRGRTVLDLHWHALPARSAFPSFDELWDRRALVSVAGRPIPTFAAYDALAHSASHSAKDHWRWSRGLVDVHRLMSSAQTWQQADRPLRHDQLLSVGLAGHLFGMPEGGPAVVRDALRMSGPQLERAILRQVQPEHAVATSALAYRAVAISVLPLWRTRARPAEVVRHVARIALPARILAEDRSSSASVAAPRAIWRRGTDLRAKLSAHR